MWAQGEIMWTPEVKAEDMPQHKNLYLSDELYKYLLDTSVYPGENEHLKELREATAQHPWGIMLLAPEQGQFFSLFVKLINAKKTIEVGVFTGYSLLLTALALPDDGKIVGIDIDRSSYEDYGLPIIKKAGVAHKVEFIESDAVLALDKMLQQGRHNEFDMAFVDADKLSNMECHERLLQLVRVGGVLAYDNTLWFGSVAKPEDPSQNGWFNKVRSFFVEFNHFLAKDPRVETSLLCIGDGLTLCRRVL